MTRGRLAVASSTTPSRTRCAGSPRTSRPTAAGRPPASTSGATASPSADASKRPDGLGKALYDPGVTGLALCAFLGAGYTNRGKHPFAKVVSSGLRYLKNIQDPEGCFGPRVDAAVHLQPRHGRARHGRGLRHDGQPDLQGLRPARLDFIALARNPYFAWRYGVKPGDNDTSVTGWMMMALKSAQLINEDAVKRGKPRAAHDRRGGLRRHPGVARQDDRSGLRPRRLRPARHGPGASAGAGRPLPRRQVRVDDGGRHARAHLHGRGPAQERDHQEGRRPAAPSCRRRGTRPTARSTCTTGTTARSRCSRSAASTGRSGRRPWRRPWSRPSARTPTTASTRARWDPIGPWGLDGGRVYSTAMMAMCLEVYYRYDRLFGGR